MGTTWQGIKGILTIIGLWLIALWSCSIHATNLVFGCRLLPTLRVFSFDEKSKGTLFDV